MNLRRLKRWIACQGLEVVALKRAQSINLLVALRKERIFSGRIIVLIPLLEGTHHLRVIQGLVPVPEGLFFKKSQILA